jgi:hypothetical protein
MNKERLAQAQKIIANPEACKVCDNCESIMKVSAGLCVICHCYRWRTEPKEVCRVAMVLGNSEPILNPIAPRI